MKWSCDVCSKTHSLVLHATVLHTTLSKHVPGTYQIEISGPCSYQGDVLVPPQQYARIVNLVWNELKARGIGAPTTEIAGPGISKLDPEDPWVLNCGECLLGAWAVHPYEASPEQSSCCRWIVQMLISLVHVFRCVTQENYFSIIL
jgi:hypothetical protein